MLLQTATDGQSWPFEGLAYGCLSRVRLVKLTAAAVLALLAPAVAWANDDAILVQLDPGREQKAISPWIYGSNHDIEGFHAWTAMRLCGNRMTTYNWLNNASNAGSDGIPKHTNDHWWLDEGLDVYWPRRSGGAAYPPEKPAAVYRQFHDEALARRAYSLVGLQMAGFVAADSAHVVEAAETAPSPRWERSVIGCSPRDEDAPDGRHAQVYVGDLVQYLTRTYGPASKAGGIRAYSLDNEPGLWHETHPRMHPEPASCEELVDKSVALAKLVKRIDPTAETFGPALWGIKAFVRLSDDSDWDEVNQDGRYAWFLDFYLDRIRQASQKADKRLLDVLDLHWYSEKQNLEGGGMTAVMNAPRTLWDAKYREPTWIGKWRGQFLPIFSKVRQSVDKYYPGTKIAITEYNWLAADQVYGGIAQADALGVFGQSGVYMACYYQPVWGADNKYVAAAFHLYRNYDGKGGRFGDISVHTRSGRPEQIGAYGSLSQDGRTLHVILTNRSETNAVSTKIVIGGDRRYTRGQTWLFDKDQAVVRKGAAVEMVGANTAQFTVPALSAVHVVLRPDENVDR